MPEIGQNLSHYSITGKIGKGGMGEVYRAKDQKLGRDVAIKVLPEEFARDTDRVARFQREAKLLASLNHPNIAAIHGLEESGGAQFLVLELVEGETLADQIKRGPVPVEECLKLALQIAEALEAAHEKGVIHRDLKPANIKVTPEGKVKVLDFGLAKAYAGDREEVNLSNSPTLSDAATQQGVILGTAAYMSPEQARGKPVDKRADVWAFGVVLFEMLTGRPIFSGDTVSDTLASVLKTEPEWKNLPKNLNARIRLMLERCLKKDPKNRYSSISDARVDIQEVLANPGSFFVEPVVNAGPRSKLRTMLPWIAAATAMGAIIAGVAIWKLKPTPVPDEPSPKIIRFSHLLPADQQLNITPGKQGPLLAVSPDGRQFVYSTTDGLCLRSVEETESKLIPGTDEHPQSPFFSADGSWIGYWSRDTQKLKKVAISGGAPVALCNVTYVLGATWCVNNTIVYSDVMKGIFRISADGGTPERLAGSYTAWPQILPGEKAVLFTSVPSEGPKIAVRSLESGETKELFQGLAAEYLPTGHLVYVFSGDLFAVPFDPDTLNVTGRPFRLAEGVMEAHCSKTGTLVCLPGAPSSESTTERTLVWVDRNGKAESIGAPVNYYRYPKISPDGTQVAVSVMGDSWDIWIWDLVRRNLSRLTFNDSRGVEGVDWYSIWSPDGRRIAFSSWRKQKAGIYSQAADGTGEAELLCSAGNMILPFSWLRSMNSLVFGVLGQGGENFDIGMVSLEGDRSPRPLLQEKYVETLAQISPDGRWMAYMSSESGQQSEIYVRPFPEVNKGKWQVSTEGGEAPLWAPDGHELFYIKGNTFMAVAVETAPAFKAGKPSLLFRGPYITGLGEGTPWDIHRDGKRFLMIRPAKAMDQEAVEMGPRKINIVLNWTEELKQKVPVK